MFYHRANCLTDVNPSHGNTREFPDEDQRYQEGRDTDRREAECEAGVDAVRPEDGDHDNSTQTRGQGRGHG